MYTVSIDLCHVQTIIDYLKMDVEYSAWDSLEKVLKEQPVNRLLNRVKQFGIEIHTRGIQHKSNTTVSEYVRYLKVLQGLNDAGFYRWYSRINTFGIFTSHHNSNFNYTCCYEMVFINTKFLT